MAFQVGQRVVCVDDSGCNIFISAGSIYQIESICDPWLRLVGIGEFCKPCNGFHRRRFRPAVERKTDISIFTSMLNPSKQTVDAR